MYVCMRSIPEVLRKELDKTRERLEASCLSRLLEADAARSQTITEVMVIRLPCDGGESQVDNNNIGVLLQHEA